MLSVAMFLAHVYLSVCPCCYVIIAMLFQMVHHLCHRQSQWCISAKEVYVLGLAQMELIFFTAVYMVLSFGFVAKTVSIRQRFGYRKTVLAQQSKLFPSLSASKWAGVGQKVGRGHN